MANEPGEGPSSVIGQVFLGAAGMAEFEAMACARPVIGHFEHGDAYPEPPPFVDARVGREIADAVIRLVDHAAERARIGERGSFATTTLSASRAALRQRLSNSWGSASACESGKGDPGGRGDTPRKGAKVFPTFAPRAGCSLWLDLWPPVCKPGFGPPSGERRIRRTRR